MHDFLDAILAAPRRPGDRVLGHSREGREIRARRIGTGPFRISLIGGCHADEPVGPRLLHHLIGHLERLPPTHALLRDHQWWIVPDANPDGAARNRAWHGDDDLHYDIGRYLQHVTREAPGDDVEFGFPRDADDREARPENRAIAAWWRDAGAPFQLHASLHGMAIGAGPWFLLDRAWSDRCATIIERCAEHAARLGYCLHDVDRAGEKGFTRIARGFCTRPDSRAMARHFRALGDETTAARFRPSSMETVRALGGEVGGEGRGDALTLVSEMPLFIVPWVGDAAGPRDPVPEAWRRAWAAWPERLTGWRARLASDGNPDGLMAELRTSVTPMPVRDQMALQWTLIAAGVAQVRGA